VPCPRCHTRLVPESYEGTRIDRCPNCRGVWLDRGELKQIVETIRVAIPAAVRRETRAAAFEGVPRDEPRSPASCPTCSATMEVVNYDYASGVLIDRCPDGHGTWLDGGELERVQAHAEEWAGRGET